MTTLDNKPFKYGKEDYKKSKLINIKTMQSFKCLKQF